MAYIGTTTHAGTVGAPALTAGAAVEVAALRKSYGTVQAVKDVSFRIERGEVFAFLGPNGAGKTTTGPDAVHADPAGRRS